MLNLWKEKKGRWARSYSGKIPVPQESSGICTLYPTDDWGRVESASLLDVWALLSHVTPEGSQIERLPLHHGELESVPVIHDYCLWFLRSAADKELTKLPWVRAPQFNMEYKSLSTKQVFWARSQAGLQPAFSALGLLLGLVVQSFDSLDPFHCCDPLRIASQTVWLLLLPDTTAPSPGPYLQPCPGPLPVWCTLALTGHQHQSPAHLTLYFPLFFPDTTVIIGKTGNYSLL